MELQLKMWSSSSFLYPQFLDHRIRSVPRYTMGVEAIFNSEPQQFKWVNFHVKATRTDEATAEHVTSFLDPQFLDHRIWSIQRYAMSLKAIVISTPRWFEWFNFHGKAMRTDGATGNNVEQHKFSVPIVFGPQKLIWSVLCNVRGSDRHLRTTMVRTSSFSWKSDENRLS